MLHSLSTRMKLFTIVIFLTATGAQEIQMEGPENTVSAVGSNVTLKCLSPSMNCSGIDWQKYVAGASPMTVFKGPRTILSVVDKDRYSVDNSSGCDLVIRNVQLTDAGRFICSAIISSSLTTKTAHLIILETQPKCTLNVSMYDTVEGDGVQLDCEVTYNGTDRASMNWKGVADGRAAVKIEKTISRSFFVKASNPELPSFTCVTSLVFDTADNGVPIVGLATNRIPNASCSTSAIRVLHSVRNVTLSPSLSIYPHGTVITCAARGHPSPTFKWQEKKTDAPWMDINKVCGSIFTVTDVSSERYRCVAMNVVRGSSYNATSHEIQFNNTEIKDNLSSTGETSSKHYIGIGIGIGILVTIVLAIIIIAILVRLGYFEFHPIPANMSLDGVAQHQDQEMIISCGSVDS